MCVSVSADMCMCEMGGEIGMSVAMPVITCETANYKYTTRQIYTSACIRYIRYIIYKQA
jgi:hypothetical protein